MTEDFYFFSLAVFKFFIIRMLRKSYLKKSEKKVFSKEIIIIK